eukprot:COSAG02_NODE_2210_length_9492_cov_22.862877_5_plen_341_part_00
MTQYIANSGLERLRELVAARVTQASPTVNTTSANCLVTPGAVMSMATAFAVCLAPGSEVLVPDPGWPNYGLSASVLGAKLVHYPCPADNAWLPDMAAMEAVLTDNTRMIVICNPSNPTGALIPEDLLRDILNLAAARGLYVLADEIYCDITYTDEPPPSTLTIAAELGIVDHVLSLGGASKSFAMTGFRVGWLRASEEIIAQATKCQEAFVSCGVPFAQAGAIAALEGDQSCVADMCASYRKRRDIAVATLEHNGMAPAAIPGGAFYMLLPCRTDGLPEDSAAFVLELLAAKSVAVAPGYTFGEQSEGYIRISLAAADADIAEGLQRFADFVREREAARN